MDEFNFYINVDECLNMSNFEMFFYKLQNDDKFYVVEASFNDDAVKNEGTTGISSIQSALYRIKNYIGQSSFLIHDYRLIFGVRQVYKKNVSWRETVLYRLLKIHYAMQNAGLYITDKVDKNVTVILLYDINNLMDGLSIADEITDFSKGIPELMEYLNVEWGESGKIPPESEIIEAMVRESERIKGKDNVTVQFVHDLNRWYSEHKLYEEDEEEDDSSLLDEDEDLRNEEEKAATERFHNINSIVSFIDSNVGPYCVFTKKISKNTGDHRLALLGIVDYITTGLAGKPESESGDGTKVTLKSLARDSWKNAKDDEVIWQKYGSMMEAYELRMRRRLSEMSGKVPSTGDRLPFDLIEPERFSYEYGGKEYGKKITEVLDEYEKSLYSVSGEKSWDMTENTLKSMLGELEMSLREFTERLSAKYKQEIRERNDERNSKKSNKKKVYDTNQLDGAIQTITRKKQKLLEELQKQKMAPHVQYQDQLNVDHAIRNCSNEINYFIKRREQIKLANFLLLFLTAGVFILVSHLILQESLLVESMNLAGVLMSAVIAVFMMICAWSSPRIYYRKKMVESVQRLKKELITYTSGYSEIATNFEEYMNIINAIDVMNHYLSELEDMRNYCNSENRKYLWHKEAIGRHQQKCVFFKQLFRKYPVNKEDVDKDIPLILDTDAIHNPFYWPQTSNGGII